MPLAEKAFAKGQVVYLAIAEKGGEGFEVNSAKVMFSGVGTTGVSKYMTGLFDGKQGATVLFRASEREAIERLRDAQRAKLDKLTAQLAGEHRRMEAIVERLLEMEAAHG